MKTFFVYLLVLLFFLFFGENGLAQDNQEIGQAFVRNFSSEDYPGHVQNWAVAQDDRGIIYIGNGDGVLEYDGEIFRLIQLPNKSTVRSLFKSTEGRIYVGGIDDFGYLAPNRSGLLTFVSLKNEIGDSSFVFTSVWQIHQIDKKIYFRTPKYLFEYSNKKIKVIDGNGAIGHSFVLNNKLYVKQRNVGLLQLDDDKLKLAPGGKEFIPISFNWAVPIGDSAVFAGDYYALYLYFPEKAKIRMIASKASEVFARHWPDCGTKLNDTLIAVGTTGEGLLVLNLEGKIIEQVDEKYGLPNQKIFGCHLDSKGRLWLATNKGFSYVDMSYKLRFWNEKGSGPKGMVLSIKRINRKIYAGAYNGLFVLENNVFKKISNSNTTVWGIEEWVNPKSAKDKRILVAAQDFLGELHDEKLVQLSPKTLVPFLTLKISKEDPNRVYIGKADGLVSMRFNGTKWVDEGAYDGINYDVRGIVEDSTGNIWLGTYRNGVVRMQLTDTLLKPQLTFYGQEAGFPSLKNILPFHYKNKILWGTETGLYQFNNEYFEHKAIGQIDKEFNDVFSFFEAQNGDLWIAGLENKKFPMGVARLKENNKYEWYNKAFWKIPEMMTLSMHVEENGKVWIGGTEGIFLYQELKKIINAPKLNTLIRKVILNYDSVLYGGYSASGNALIGEKPIPANHNKLTFHYSIPDYNFSRNKLYSYKLEGYDNEWSEWTLASSKEYTNLGGGKYIFKVKGRSADNETTVETTYEFNVLYPWYLKWYTIVCYSIALALLVYAIVKLYTRRLKQANINLESIIKERTHKIQQQNEEIKAQAEQIEKDSKKRFRLYFDNSPLGIFICDNNGYIKVANPSGTKMFNINQKVNEGAFSSFIINKDSNKVNTLFDSVLGQKHASSEMMVDAGESKTILVRVNAVLLSESEILVFAEDISLQKQNEKRVLKAVINTEEKERKRFAEDLHDELGPFLSGIKLYIDLIQQPDLDKEKRLELSEYLNQMINEAVNKTKAISNNMRPGVLTDYGLIGALNSFIDKVEITGVVKINFENNIGNKRLDFLVEVIVYRVLIELINNTIKHADANIIMITLLEDDDALKLTYQDDGAGFDLEKTVNGGKGMGLKNISSRLDSIEAEYRFFNAKEKGVAFESLIKL